MRISNIIYSVLAMVLVIVPTRASAQNVQLHYDLGRNAATTTVEMFRPDAGGSTFFFVDMDYSPKVSGAYWEIAREFNFWQDSKVNWLSVHVEYNGGLNTVAGSFNNSILAGLTYSGHSKDWSKTWSVTASYKVIPGTIALNGEKQPHNFQITGVWNLDFFDHWLSFNGFADFWREARPWQGTKCIFITEPQLWVNLNKIEGWEKINLSVGTEIEMSCNFVQKGFKVMPTAALKWTF
ncbi:MAG: DUF5020 family protein [Alistipes sp.]|nr:DUF5020 family protein [Alistipes sp.]